MNSSVGERYSIVHGQLIYTMILAGGVKGLGKRRYVGGGHVELMLAVVKGY